MILKKRVAVLISGRGSNMMALIEAAKSADYPAQIVGVLANKADAEGLVKAEELGIPTAVVQIKDYADKAAADSAIDKQMHAWSVEIICLAGFMRILSPRFCRSWHGQIINIHPSLLPAFKGLDTHQRALDAQVSDHGCTVHFVTAGMDDGPIIGQVAVPVQVDDDVDSLAARILRAEHRLYPWALGELAAGRISISTAFRN